jgi:hypothetical protein
LTDVAADRQTLTALESIHDCIDMNANASRLPTAATPKFCIGDRSAVANLDVEPLAEPAGLGPPRPHRVAGGPAPCVRGDIERKNDTSSHSEHGIQ